MSTRRLRALRAPGILCIALIGCLACSQSTAQTFKRGDSNCDGRGDLSDGIFTLQSLFSDEELCCFDSADANDSGRVDLSDAVFWLSFLFRGGEAPAAPFPDCGLDLSDDPLRCEAYPHCSVETFAPGLGVPGGDLGRVLAPGATTEFAVVAVGDDGESLAGVEVEFHAPNSGASGFFEGASEVAGHFLRATTDDAGRASATFLANHATGRYYVDVRLPGTAHFAIFGVSQGEDLESPPVPSTAVTGEVRETLLGEGLKYFYGPLLLESGEALGFPPSGDPRFPEPARPPVRVDRPTWLLWINDEPLNSNGDKRFVLVDATVEDDEARVFDATTWPELLTPDQEDGDRLLSPSSTQLRPDERHPTEPRGAGGGGTPPTRSCALIISDRLSESLRSAVRSRDFFESQLGERVAVTVLESHRVETRLSKSLEALLDDQCDKLFVHLTRFSDGVVRDYNALFGTIVDAVGDRALCVIDDGGRNFAELLHCAGFAGTYVTSSPRRIILRFRGRGGDPLEFSGNYFDCWSELLETNDWPVDSAAIALCAAERQNGVQFQELEPEPLDGVELPTVDFSDGADQVIALDTSIAGEHPARIEVEVDPEAASVVVGDSHSNDFDYVMPGEELELRFSRRAGAPDTSTYTVRIKTANGCVEGVGTLLLSETCPVEESRVVDVTSRANVRASSVFSPQFRASLSTDGSRRTSWFSDGTRTGGDSEFFVWRSVDDTAPCIDLVAIRNNSEHATPEFREGFGFERLRVSLIDDTNRVVFARFFDISGPDPNVVVEIGGVQAREVRLDYTQHENPACGGFSELEVRAREPRE